jgi:hypothetical protein
VYIGSSIKEEVLDKETFAYAKILIGNTQRRNSGFFLPLIVRSRNSECLSATTMVFGGLWRSVLAHIDRYLLNKRIII